MDVCTSVEESGMSRELEDAVVLPGVGAVVVVAPPIAPVDEDDVDVTPVVVMSPPMPLEDKEDVVVVDRAVVDPPLETMIPKTMPDPGFGTGSPGPSL